MTNVLFVGLIDPESPRTLCKPRMVFVEQGTMKVSLAKCIGNPDTMEIVGTVDFKYNSNDAEFEKFYRQETTDIPGLTIVKN